MKKLLSRIIIALVALIALITLPAFAELTKAEVKALQGLIVNETKELKMDRKLKSQQIGRYQHHIDNDGGIIVLDTVTGQMRLCTVSNSDLTINCWLWSKDDRSKNRK